MRLTDRRVRAFVDALASTQPAPGGGSAAALGGALGAALYVMVCRIVLARRPATQRGAGRPGVPRRRLQRVRAACERQRRALLQLIEADARAYGRLVAVWRNVRKPGTVPVRGQSLAALSPALRKAQRQALVAPMAICERTMAVLQCAPVLASAAGRALASDVAAGSSLLIGGFAAAASTAAVNLDGMGQSAQAAAIRRRVRQLTRTVASLSAHG